MEVLSKNDTIRIELKFECLRRSKEYVTDYELQQNRNKHGDNKMQLWKYFYSRWFHSPLLNPAIPIRHYRKKKNYRRWLKETLGNLLTADCQCPQNVRVESPELGKYLRWKKSGYQTFINIREGKIVKIPFPKGDKIYSKLNGQKLRNELRNLRVTLDLKSFTENDIKIQIGNMLKDLKPVVKMFLDKGSLSVRPSVIEYYLKTYDRNQKLSYTELADRTKIKPTKIEHQKRKFKDHVKNAKALINGGGWHYI